MPRSVPFCFIPCSTVHFPFRYHSVPIRSVPDRSRSVPVPVQFSFLVLTVPVTVPVPTISIPVPDPFPFPFQTVPVSDKFPFLFQIVPVTVPVLDRSRSVSYCLRSHSRPFSFLTVPVPDRSRSVSNRSPSHSRFDRSRPFLTVHVPFLSVPDFFLDRTGSPKSQRGQKKISN